MATLPPVALEQFSEAEDVPVPATLQESIDALESNCRWTIDYWANWLLDKLPGGPPVFDQVRSKWKLRDGYEDYPLPDEDTDVPPGPDKVAVMAQRYEQGRSIFYPLTLFYDRQGRVVESQGDATISPTGLGELVITRKTTCETCLGTGTMISDGKPTKCKTCKGKGKRHWNGSIIHLGLVDLADPKLREEDRKREIEDRRRMDEEWRRVDEARRRELANVAKAAMEQRRLLLIERHQLMKGKQMSRPKEAMACACPTCAAPAGERCRGGRIHKLRRKAHQETQECQEERKAGQ